MLSASEIIEKSRPKDDFVHLIETKAGNAFFTVERNGLINGTNSVLESIESSIRYGDLERTKFLSSLIGITPNREEVFQVDSPVKVKTVSLSIAQKCNLGCTYCYADKGSFGETPENMPDNVSEAAIDQLLSQASPGDTVTVVFLGGEPLVNRTGLRSLTKYATRKAELSGVKVSFAITTNGTLLNKSDFAFFNKYGFSVTVSLDGIGTVNDALRPFKSGVGSFERVVKRLAPIGVLKQRHFSLTARVTVTPENLKLKEALIGLKELGFDSIRFSPMLSSPTGANKMDATSMELMLDAMIQCAQLVEQELENNHLIPFGNFTNTLKQIDEGQQNSYPCGAGGSYVSVSAKGEYYACHRFVEDERGKLGGISKGLDPELKSNWIKDRHLRHQAPCQTCWARNMCGGSCHYEVINAGRPACDYIRGWIYYCLRVYVRLSKTNPNGLRALIKGSF